MKRLSAMQIFISNLERIRKERNLTQTELADLLGTKQPAISRLLRGEEDITLTRAEKWAELLGVPFADLVLQPEFSK